MVTRALRQGNIALISYANTVWYNFKAWHYQHWSRTTPSGLPNNLLHQHCVAYPGVRGSEFECNRPCHGRETIFADAAQCSKLSLVNLQQATKRAMWQVPLRLMSKALHLPTCIRRTNRQIQAQKQHAHCRWRPVARHTTCTAPVSLAWANPGTHVTDSATRLACPIQ